MSRPSPKPQLLDPVFLTTAVHDLKTPLLAVKLLLEAVLDPKAEPLSRTQRGNLLEVAKSNEQVFAMVRDILTMVKAEGGDMTTRREIVNLREAIERVVTELQSLLREKRIRVAWEGEPLAGAALKTNPEALGQIAQNLLSNAVKYNRAGGRVIVRIEAMDGKRIALPPLFARLRAKLAKKSWCVVTVADTGLGIPREEQKKIFAQFFRASNVRTADPYGTGLGLFLTKTLVEKLGGVVWFSSQEGKGSAFSVAFPSVL